MNDIRILHLPITKRKKIAENTVEISFDLEKSDFTFQPGQYVRLTLPKLDYPDPAGAYRDFSIATSPSDKKVLKVAFRIGESGFKRTLLKLPLRTKIKVTGPFGNLVLPPPDGRDIVAIAGGIGITPFYSWLRSEEQSLRPRNINLIYANSDAKSAAYLEEIKKLAKKDKRLKLNAVFGPIDDRMLRELVPDPLKPSWFLAGKPLMVSNLRDLLLAMGVKDKDVYSEEYLGYEPGSDLSSIAAFKIKTAKTSLPDDAIGDGSRFRALLSALEKTALVSETDAAGNIVYVNDRFVESTGYERDELIGQNHRILKSGQQTQAEYRELWKTITAGKVWHGEVKDRAKDGSFYWVDTNIAPIYENDSRIPSRYISVRFPITERKLNEERLERLYKQTAERESQENAILASLGEGLVETDADGIINKVNAAAVRLLGFSAEEMVGKSFEFLHTRIEEDGDMRELALVERPFYQAIHLGKRTLNAKIRYRRKDGAETLVLITVTPVVRGEMVIGAVGIFRDFSEEERIDRLKSEFISVAAHQLRTPLTIIGWYAELLLDKGADGLNQQQQQFIGNITKANERMIALIKALLDVSRLELGTFVVKPEPLDLVERARAAIFDFRPMIESKGLKVIEEYPGTPLMIAADRNLLGIILQNLLSNAVKYTHYGGTVTLKVAGPDDKAGCRITVKDTGIGIPAIAQKDVFSKLYRADNAKMIDPEGTGLGLYIIKTILEEVGGSIAFESEEGKGSAFTVTLPPEGMSERLGTRQLGL